MTTLRLGVRGFMKDKDGNRADSSMMEAQTSPNSNTRFFIRLRGAKVIVGLAAFILLAIWFQVYQNNNPSGAPFLSFSIMVGNSNGDNNSSRSYDDRGTVEPEPLEEDTRPEKTIPSEEYEQPSEPELSKEPASSEEPAPPKDKCADTRYYVVPWVGLRLREGPSTASEILRILPYKYEVIGEGCADERGWMPVYVDGRHGYVFAAYIDTIS